jgi:hypothetical protein
MKNIFLSLLSCFAISCATETPATPDDYIKVIEAHSAGDVEYVGAYNHFNFRATLMNSTIQNAIIDRKAAIYLWNNVKKQQEMGILQADNASMTKVFISFYTPDRRDDNLASPKSIWALYLETPNGRYTGSAKKVRTSPTELMTLHPNHNRFTTAYNVEFPVALASVEGQKLKLTITGPLGTRSVEFVPEPKL